MDLIEILLDQINFRHIWLPVHLDKNIKRENLQSGGPEWTAWEQGSLHGGRGYHENTSKAKGMTSLFKILKYICWCCSQVHIFFGQMNFRSVAPWPKMKCGKRIQEKKANGAIDHPMLSWGEIFMRTWNKKKMSILKFFFKEEKWQLSLGIDIK